MKKWILAVVLIVISASFLHAKEYKLDENKRLEIHISSTEQNRIKILGDRIAEVVGVTGDYLLESEERQGQIFIQPKEGAQDLSFTLISENGISQDIKVMPKEKIPGQIILLKGKEKPIAGKFLGVKNTRHEDIANMLKTLSQQKIDAKVRWQDRGNLRVKKISSQRAGVFEVEIWLLHNRLAQKSLKLSERQFNTESNIAAIMLEDLEIAPKDITKLYKVRYHG